MTRTRLSLFCLLILPWIAGCIEVNVVVHINKDGSGTIEQTQYTKTADLGPGVKVGDNDLEAKKAEAEQTAAKMGEGVTVKSMAALPKRGEWSGFKTVFAFEDINKVKFKPTPEAGPPGDPAAEEKPDKIKFSFTPGDTATLTVMMPPITPPGDDGPGDQKEMPPEMMAAFAPMFEGAKLEVSVEVEGTITNTDARYTSPTKKSVGLIRMDLGKLMKDNAALKEMMAINKIKDPQQAAARLNAKPLSKYIKAETKESIEIEFE